MFEQNDLCFHTLVSVCYPLPYWEEGDFWTWRWGEQVVVHSIFMGPVLLKFSENCLKHCPKIAQTDRNPSGTGKGSALLHSGLVVEILKISSWLSFRGSYHAPPQYGNVSSDQIILFIQHRTICVPLGFIKDVGCMWRGAILASRTVSSFLWTVSHVYLGNEMLNWEPK